MKQPGTLKLSFALTVAALAWAIANGQVKNAAASAGSPSCSHENALELIRQQIDATRTFDDPVQRIAVLLRAADMLWPHQQDNARAAFTEAFELATLNFKEKGDKPRQESVGMIATTPDQRYVVIGAIARRDYSWARKLTDQVLKLDADEAKEKGPYDQRRDRRIPEQLFGMASAQLPADVTTAVDLARISLQSTATLLLPIFLYRLADVNQPVADQFYQEALAAYRDQPMEEFLYLSAYPFGNTRDAGEMPGYAYYRIPGGFTPNVSLQRLFVQTLLRRAQQALEQPAESETIMQRTDSEQIWLALTRLEKQIQQSLPELYEAAQQAKGNSFAAQSQKSQADVTELINSQNRPKKTFDERVEAADRERDPVERDQLLAFAVLGAPATENLEHVLSAVEKLDDPHLKEQLLNWLYFNRSQSAINFKQFDQARRLAAKLSELDQRAYLYSEIAKDALNHAESQLQAREILDEVATAAGKAPATMVTARTLLAVAYLYSKIDLGRSLSALADAIKCINRIEAPDFSRQVVIRKIEGKTFGSYASFQTPGFSPENVFRELGKFDFDGALYQASNFENKSLRSLTILALAEACVKPAKAPPIKPAKTPAKGETRKTP